MEDNILLPHRPCRQFLSIAGYFGGCGKANDRIKINFYSPKANKSVDGWGAN